MISNIQKWWHRLPPKLQATLVIAASTAGTFLGEKASQYLLDPSTACWQWTCLRHTLVSASLAGIVAAKAFYMRPGPGAPQVIGSDGKSYSINDPKLYELKTPE